MKGKVMKIVKIKTILISVLCSLLIIACSGVKFLGAQKYGGTSFYTERWFLNPEYDKKDIPKGTGFYGAAAEKISEKFTIKYYIDQGHATVEIPPEHMWKVRHNGKRGSKYQDDDNLYFYVKDGMGGYKKYWIGENASGPVTIRENELLPIKNCENGWCELYPADFHRKTVYVKQSILYQDDQVRY